MRAPTLLAALLTLPLGLPLAARADAPVPPVTPAATATATATSTPAPKDSPTAQAAPSFTATPSPTPDLDANDDADVAEDAAAASAAPPVTGTASGAYHLVKRVPLPGDKGWDYCLADSEARRLYITHGDQLLVLDLDSAKLLGKVGGMLGIHGVAVARDLGRGYVSDGKAGSVACFDLRSLSPVASIVARPDVDAIVYEPGTQQVFAFSGDDQSCTVIDAPSNAVVATIDLGGKPEFAAVDNDTTVYVNLVDTDELLSIDAKTRTILRRRTVAPGSKPSSLVYDADGDNLFIGCRNGQAVVMGAASGLTKAAFAIGQRVDAAAFDAQQRLAFHSCGDGTVSVLRRESDGGFTPLPALATKKGSRTMALDQKTHRLYLPAADFGPEPSPSADQPHPRPSMVPGSFSVLIYGRDAK